MRHPLTPIVLLAACGSVTTSGADAGDCDVVCGGECVDLETDGDHCGACDNACGGDQSCRAGVCESFESFAVARIEAAPRDPTGWVDENGDAIAFTFAPIDGVDELVYECRSAPVALLPSTPFVPCDAADGSAPEHRPVPDPVAEEGSYQTEVRIRIGEFTSESAVASYYVHRSLDSAPTCPPPFGDDEIFAAADELRSGNPPAFGAETATRNPFVSLPFVDIQPSAAARSGGGPWASLVGADFTVEARSLRRRFALSNDRQLLLVQRQYASRRALDAGETDPSRLCRNGIRYRTRTTNQGDEHIDCQTLVLDSRGESRCVIDEGGAPVARFPSSNGFIKLGRRMFSPKGDDPTCPGNEYNPGACGFDYLVLPQ